MTRLCLVEVDVRVDAVDDLAQECPVLHVVERVFEHAPNKGCAITLDANEVIEVQLLQGGEQTVIDEIEKIISCGRVFGADRVHIGPRTPTQVRRDRRFVAAVYEFQLLFQVAVDLVEKQPTKLADALRIAIDTCVFAHGILDRLDRRRKCHGHPRSMKWGDLFAKLSHPDYRRARTIQLRVFERPGDTRPFRQTPSRSRSSCRTHRTGRPGERGYPRCG